MDAPILKLYTPGTLKSSWFCFPSEAQITRSLDPFSVLVHLDHKLYVFYGESLSHWRVTVHVPQGMTFNSTYPRRFPA